MAYQATPNGIEVVFNATQNTVPVVNVYHVKTPSEVTDTMLEDVADMFNFWWQTYMQELLAESYVLNTIVATDISVEDGHQFTVTLTSDNQGTVTGEGTAGNAAVVMSWRTANIGRSFRGRTYVGGLPASVLLTAQTITTTYQTDLTLAAVGLIDSLESIGMILSVLSRVANLVERVTGLLTQIINVVVDNKVDSQRRRTAN